MYIPTKITDSTSGSASSTLAAIPAPTDSPADADALRDDINTNILPVIRDALATLAAKVNYILDAIQDVK